MNSLMVAGGLGKDAEIRFLPNGDPVASFSVADDQGKDKPTIWWNCQLFGKRAESLAPYLTKGQAVTVTGTVTQRTYTDKNGQERTSMDLRVNDLKLQGGKREEAPQTNRKHDAARARQPAAPADFDEIPF
jgi:single-strand DNA-binding protein